MTCSHMEGSVGGVVAVVGAVEDEDCHQDEEGYEDHHPVALLPLQFKQEWWDLIKCTNSRSLYYI